MSAGWFSPGPTTEAEHEVSRWGSRRRWLKIAGGALAVAVLFITTTAFTGLDAPGSLRRYKVNELRALAARLNEDAGDHSTPDDCWRRVHGASGPGRPIAGVNYLTSRVELHIYGGRFGRVEPSTFRAVTDRADAIIGSHDDWSWSMVQTEVSPDGWSPLVSCALVTRGY